MSRFLEDTKKWVVLGLALAGLAIGSDATAKEEDDGIPVTVRVLDAVSQAPVPTAVVRNPQEEERHRVNTELGSWSGSVFYLPDGTEVKFAKGQVIQFEISAPGYVNQVVDYTVRKRRNAFDVFLQKMTVDMTEENPDDVMIQFGRDKPID